MTAFCRGLTIENKACVSGLSPWASSVNFLFIFWHYLNPSMKVPILDKKNTLKNKLGQYYYRKKTQEIAKSLKN
jgi:hypothetical protein